ncbi:uncharacterized protein prr33 [Stegostoma tigrinum]|uniref:uncharacterized protein prr33 n=1 Tax=Stegostoma tigrinum TaxID=3053191 RepID=UPI002870713E|nr:uncharacterized protein prr33 [Stegostoma tigrinum]
MGIKMLMAVTTLPATSHYVSPNPKPPPLAPKPDKDNIKLQKILKRAAKRKAAQTYLQAMDASEKSHSYLPKPFRSSLSPVNEAGPDLEYYEHHSRSPRSLLSPTIPGSPFPPHRQGPAIVTHAHVASPYPARKSFYKGKIELLPKIQISAPQSPAENQNQALRKLPPPMAPAKLFTIPTIQSGIKAQEFPRFSVPPRFSPSIYTPRSWPTSEVPTANISTGASIAFKAPDVPELHVTNTFGANGPDMNVANAAVPVDETFTVKMATNEAEVETFLHSPRARAPAHEATRSSAKFDLFGANALQNEVSQENLTKNTADTSAIKNDNLTVGIGAVKLEIQRTEMTAQKIKAETKPRPLDIAVETITHEGAEALPKAEAQLQSPDRVKPLKSKVSGWTRLKKHMIVEEPPKFPEPEPDLPQSGSQEENQDKSEAKKQESQKAKVSRANKMWDAVLFQMFAAEQHKQSEEESILDKSKQIQQAPPVFSSRLPLLLFRPRFDARKLKEAAERPLKKISTTLYESGLHRKRIEDEELKDFNRTAKGWPTQHKETS